MPCFCLFSQFVHQIATLVPVFLFVPLALDLTYIMDIVMVLAQLEPMQLEQTVTVCISFVQQKPVQTFVCMKDIKQNVSFPPKLLNVD